jgi:hypothetical protein
MKIELKREHGTKDYTEGSLYIDGVLFCDTLEDEERIVKKAAVTAIPMGKYRIIINDSVRFKRKLPLLLNVPNFTGIRIHAGNTVENTEGCILVGRFARQGIIRNSRVTFDALFKKMSEAVQRDQDIWITIT